MTLTATEYESWNMLDRLGVSLAQRIAMAVSRRGFIGRSARTAGGVIIALVAGEGLQAAFASPASAGTIYSCDGAIDGVGAGCPSASEYGKPCGPDPCCIHLSSACNCSDNPGVTYCHSHSQKSDCDGYADDYSGGQLSSCWTCYGPALSCGSGCAYRYITICCDCKTSSSCSADNICISYDMYSTKITGSVKEVYKIPLPAPNPPVAPWTHPEWRIE